MQAHQEVILGAIGQTLTIRQDAYDRQSYMPGVLLACKHVARLPAGVTRRARHVARRLTQVLTVGSGDGQASAARAAS